MMITNFSNEFASEAWRTIWDGSIHGICLVAEDGTFLRANPNFCRITEYTETELQLKTFQQITHPDDVEADVAEALAVSEGENPWYDMTKRYITKTGRVTWILLRVRPVLDGDGNFACFLSQIMEVSPIAELSQSLEPSPKSPTPKSPGALRLSERMKDAWATLTIAAIAGAAIAGFVYDLLMAFLEKKQ